MRIDTLVIGAGMSGLAAGIRLAQFDRPVAILEKHNLWGGLNSFYTLGGRAFDVGLHALTNYVPAGTRGAPLTRILRQLRIRHADFRLGEQDHSEIVFPGVRIDFSNEFERMREEIARTFPDQAEGFDRLVERVRAERPFDALPEPTSSSSELDARAVVGEYLSDPLLVEMLMLPVAFYGSAREHAIDWDLFVILFHSIFLEGLSRPEGGIRTILNILIRRYRSLGGELRMNCGVRRILVEGGRARGVELDNGEVIEANHILSSAGLVETMDLCRGGEGGEGSDEGADIPVLDEAARGRISFLETISVLDTEPAMLGHRAATSFYSLNERFHYGVPEEDVDPSCGVVSAPNNFASEKPMKEGMARLTVLSRSDAWDGLTSEAYEAKRGAAADLSLEEVLTTPHQNERGFFPDWRPHTIFRDVFTPSTITRFTSRQNGAVYGSPIKHFDGRSGIDDLFLIGTDQGMLGVIGAMTSGIAMANNHVISPALGVS